MNGPTANPREEARPFSWSLLTNDQQDAARRVHELVATLAALPYRPDQRHDYRKRRPEIADIVLPQIHMERPNNVVLVDGGRGSGKTSVMLSLLNHWSIPLRADLMEEERGRNSRKQGDLLDLPPLEVNVFPLPVLDLQPIPESTQLIVQLAGSFLRVIEAIELRRGGFDSERGAPPAWQMETDELPSRRAWREFIGAVALGWDGNLQERRAQLDPDAFILELEQTERYRMEVKLKWAPLVDAVLEDVVAANGLLPRKEKPLFVIPIDDADMNPVRSVELLDLMRTLWHPRVMFLLTGDSDLFVVAARHHFLGALRRPLRNVPLAEGEAKRLGDVDKAISLARELFDRVIPPGHRCELSALSPAAAMKVLRPDLEQIKVPTVQLGDKKAQTLYQLLQTNPPLQKLLPDRLRAIADYGLAIKATVGRTLTAADALNLLRTSLKQSSLLQVQQRRILASIEEVPGTTRVAIRESPWRLVETVPVARRAHLESAVVTLGGAPTFVARYQGQTTKSRVDAVTTASLILLKLFADDDLSVVEHHGDFLVTTHKGLRQHLFDVRWPAPPFQRFVSQLAFGLAWAEVVQRPGLARPSQAQVDELAFCFLSLAVQLLRREVEATAPPTWSTGFALQLPDKPTEEGWEKVADDLVYLINTRSSDAQHWALTKAPLIVLREAGVSTEAGKIFFAAVKRALEGARVVRWANFRNVIQVARKDRIKEAAGVDGDAEALELAGTFGEIPFPDPPKTSAPPSGGTAKAG